MAPRVVPDGDERFVDEVRKLFAVHALRLDGHVLAVGLEDRLADDVDRLRDVVLAKHRQHGVVEARDQVVKRKRDSLLVRWGDHSLQVDGLVLRG